MTFKTLEILDTSEGDAIIIQSFHSLSVVLDDPYNGSGSAYIGNKVVAEIFSQEDCPVFIKNNYISITGKLASTGRSGEWRLY